ncbi:hypothetical protein [Geomonas subterranea]|uniref:hypothetical protein n=1 Tax=Geomonas subterranea TaxID=2847989 RepID=UPI001CD5EC23|nr:hypothetical protein [Geomonas fuzhouensis]
MPQTVSIEGKRANATIFASNLIKHGQSVIFLTAYGPTQEVRAFAQVLLEGGNIETENARINGAHLGGMMKVIPGFANGYSGLYVIPTENRYLVGDTDEECHGIFARILDQAYFVHRDWYADLATLNARLEPVIGSKKCFIVAKDIVNEVQGRVKYGCFKFPAITAQITIDRKEEEAQPSA